MNSSSLPVYLVIPVATLCALLLTGCPTDDDTGDDDTGCTYATTAHTRDYLDYSTGFRCCQDAD